MNIEIKEVKELSQIESVAILADEIWTEHYTSIIGSDQVRYMVDKFQSNKAISAQIDDGCNYYLAYINGDPVGYITLIIDNTKHEVMISKIYVKSKIRKNGIGQKFIELAESECKRNNHTKIWLTVNRFNTTSIDWYKKQGFSVINEIKKDIGNGFVMDDYVMEKIF